MDKSTINTCLIIQKIFTNVNQTFGSVEQAINSKASVVVQQRLSNFFLQSTNQWNFVFVGIGFYSLSGFSGYSTGFSSDIGSVFLVTMDSVFHLNIWIVRVFQGYNLF